MCVCVYALCSHLIFAIFSAFKPNRDILPNGISINRPFLTIDAHKNGRDLKWYGIAGRNSNNNRTNCSYNFRNKLLKIYIGHFPSLELSKLVTTWICFLWKKNNGPGKMIETALENKKKNERIKKKTSVCFQQPFDFNFK